MNSVAVPYNEAVTYSWGEIRKENPFGLEMHTAVLQVSFRDECYQLIDSPTNEPDQPAIDIETGDIVYLTFEQEGEVP